MNGLMGCIGYLAVAGILSFLIGRVIPKRWFNWEDPFYQSRSFEQNGKFYDRFYIRKWKDIVPDMNKILPALVPDRVPKTIHSSKEEVEELIQETCVAEVVHLALAVVGLRCVHIWPGWPGCLVAVLNVIGNLPFVMIQRYNRPRFCKIYRKFTAEERRTAQLSGCEGETA